VATTVSATLIAELPDITGGDTVVRIALDYDHRPLILTHHLPEPSTATVDRWAAEFGIPRNAVLRVWRQDAAGGWGCADLPDPPMWAQVQPLADGGWLVAASRAVEPEHNATIFDRQGVKVGSFHAGDAIAHVQATSDGRVWIANFDEYLGGDNSALPEGLICLDLVGRRVFGFHDVATDDIPYIDDCYALNVVDEHETWLCYYSGFPLVKLVDYAAVRMWSRPPVVGAHAFAVGLDRVLLSPGYRRRDPLTLVDLHTSAKRRIGPLDDRGRRIPISERCVARGPRMFFLDGTRLFGLDVRELE
jgi:hypothetical protein